MPLNLIIGYKNIDIYNDKKCSKKTSTSLHIEAEILFKPWLELVNDLFQQAPTISILYSNAACSMDNAWNITFQPQNTTTTTTTTKKTETESKTLKNIKSKRSGISETNDIHVYYKNKKNGQQMQKKKSTGRTQCLILKEVFLFPIIMAKVVDGIKNDTLSMLYLLVLHNNHVQ